MSSRSPMLALFAQMPAPSRSGAKPGKGKSHQAGSGTSAILACVRRAAGGIGSGEVARLTGLSSSIVRTALNRLEHFGEIERTNEEWPYLYRKTKAASAAQPKE